MTCDEGPVHLQKTILNVICLFTETSSFNSSGNSCDPPHKETWFAPPKPSLCRPIAVCRRELGACRPRWQPPIFLCQSGPSYLAPAMAVIRRGCQYRYMSWIVYPHRTNHIARSSSHCYQSLSFSYIDATSLGNLPARVRSTASKKMNW